MFYVDIGQLMGCGGNIHRSLNGWRRNAWCTGQQSTQCRYIPNDMPVSC